MGMVEGRKWICADGVGMGEMNELGTGVIGTDVIWTDVIEPGDQTGRPYINLLLDAMTGFLHK